MNTVKKSPAEEDRPGLGSEEEEDESDESGEYEDEEEIDLDEDDIWDDSVLIKMYEASQKQINDELTKRITGRTSEEVTGEEATSSGGGTEAAASIEAESKTPTNTNSNNDGNKSSTSATTNKKPVKSNKLTLKSKICPSLSRHNPQQPQLSLSKPMYSWKEGDFCQATYLEDGVDYEAKIIAINPADQTCTIRYIGYENVEHRVLPVLKPSAGERVRKLQIDMAIQDGYSGGGGGAASSTKATLYNNVSSVFDAEVASVGGGGSGGHQRQSIPELSLIPKKTQQQLSFPSHHHQHQQQYHHHHHNLPPPPQSGLLGGPLGSSTANNSSTNNPNRIIPPPPPFLNATQSAAPPEGVSNVANVLQAITNNAGPNSSGMGGVLPTEDDDDVLASMLMSWYMTGYHTGYYQARKDLMKS